MSWYSGIDTQISERDRARLVRGLRISSYALDLCITADGKNYRAQAVKKYPPRLEDKARDAKFPMRVSHRRPVL